jgi:hypothetical protein
VLSGEGVLGLSSAFLSAGVPAVLATLWPVDDLTTARLMEAFYAGLASGNSAAEALRHAQGVLRSNPATSLPFYWSAFVLVGDGDIAAPLRRRSVSPWVYTLGVLGAVVLVGGVLSIARRHRHRHSPPHRQHRREPCREPRREPYRIPHRDAVER